MLPRKGAPNAPAAPLDASPASPKPSTSYAHSMAGIPLISLILPVPLPPLYAPTQSPLGRPTAVLERHPWALHKCTNLWMYLVSILQDTCCHSGGIPPDKGLQRMQTKSLPHGRGNKLNKVHTQLDQLQSNHGLSLIRILLSWQMTGIRCSLIIPTRYPDTPSHHGCPARHQTSIILRLTMMHNTSGVGWNNTSLDEYMLSF